MVVVVVVVVVMGKTCNVVPSAPLMKLLVVNCCMLCLRLPLLDTEEHMPAAARHSAFITAPLMPAFKCGYLLRPLRGNLLCHVALFLALPRVLLGIALQHLLPVRRLLPIALQRQVLNMRSKDRAMFQLAILLTPPALGPLHSLLLTLLLRVLLLRVGTWLVWHLTPTSIRSAAAEM